MTITGWAAFWIGLAACIIVGTIMDYFKTARECRCVEKILRQLGELDEQKLLNIIRKLVD